MGLDNKHVGVIRLLLEKSADDIEDVLLTGIREGNEELVKVALDRGGQTRELDGRTGYRISRRKEGKHHRDVEEAGAQAPLQVDAATLQSYAGKYKGDTGPKHDHGEGRQAVCRRIHTRTTTLISTDKTTFRPVNFGGITLTFNAEGAKSSA